MKHSHSVILEHKPCLCVVFGGDNNADFSFFCVFICPCSSCFTWLSTTWLISLPPPMSSACSLSSSRKLTSTSSLNQRNSASELFICHIFFLPLMLPSYWLISKSITPSSGEMCDKSEWQCLPCSLSGTCACWSWSTLAGLWWRSTRLWQLVWPSMSWWSSVRNSGLSCTLKGWFRETSAALWVEDNTDKQLNAQKNSWFVIVLRFSDFFVSSLFAWRDVSAFSLWFIVLSPQESKQFLQYVTE